MPHKSRVLKTRFLKSTAESLTIWWRRTNDLMTMNSNEEQIWVGDWTIWTTKIGAIWQRRTTTKNRGRTDLSGRSNNLPEELKKSWGRRSERKKKEGNPAERKIHNKEEDPLCSSWSPWVPFTICRLWCSSRSLLLFFFFSVDLFV